MTKQRIPVLVTTIHRGVFFGYASTNVKDKSITIEDGRNCIYWSAISKWTLDQLIDWVRSVEPVEPVESIDSAIPFLAETVHQ